MMSKKLSEKYDEVCERLRDVEYRSLDNERFLGQLRKDVIKIQNDVIKLQNDVGKLQKQVPEVGSLIDDSNEFAMCILFRHVINQPIEPGLRARLIVEQTEDGAGRLYLDHVDVEEGEGK